MTRDPSYFSHPWWDHAYRTREAYADQLARWLAVFPREQLHVIVTEELLARPAAEYAGAWSSWVSPHHALAEFPRIFERDYPPWRRRASGSWQRLREAANGRLERLLGRRLAGTAERARAQPAATATESAARVSEPAMPSTVRPSVRLEGCDGLRRRRAVVPVDAARVVARLLQGLLECDHIVARVARPQGHALRQRAGGRRHIGRRHIGRRRVPAASCRASWRPAGSCPGRSAPRSGRWGVASPPPTARTTSTPSAKTPIATVTAATTRARSPRIRADAAVAAAEARRESPGQACSSAEGGSHGADGGSANQSSSAEIVRIVVVPAAHALKATRAA